MVASVTGSVGSIGFCAMFYGADARLKVLHQLLPDSFTVRNKNGNLPSGKLATLATVLRGHVNMIQYIPLWFNMIQWHLQDFKLGLRLIGDVQRHVGAGDRAHSFTLPPVPKSGSWWMFTTCISIQFHTYIIYPSKGHGFLQFEVLKLGCWSLLKENVDSSNIVWWTNHFPW